MLKLVPLPSALMLALAFSAPASAQTGAVVPPIIGLPATEWEAGYAKPLDGELALEPDIYARLIRYARASDPATLTQGSGLGGCGREAEALADRR